MWVGNKDKAVFEAMMQKSAVFRKRFVFNQSTIATRRGHEGISIGSILNPTLRAHFDRVAFLLLANRDESQCFLSIPGLANNIFTRSI